MITEEEINEIVSNSRQNVNKKNINGIFLSDYQINVLKERNIKYDFFTDLKQLLYEIEDYLNYQEDEELERISQELAEFDYYHNFNK